MEMAGAARSAVSSLLGSLSSVISDEVKQLRGVRRELESIADELESMNSFLLELDQQERPSPPQRTWMRQVRDLAHSAEHCVSLQQALIHREGRRARGLLGYLPPVQTLYARHRLAVEARELNARIKNVNERRQRYDVQVLGSRSSGPQAAAAPPPSSSSAGGGEFDGAALSDSEETALSEATRAQSFSESRILEECTRELVDWLLGVFTVEGDTFPCIAIAAQGEKDGADVAREALAHPSVAAKFGSKVWVTFPSYLPPLTSNILQAIRHLLPGDVLPNTEKLDRRIKEIAERTQQHLQAQADGASPEEIAERTKQHLQAQADGASRPLGILCGILQDLLPLQPVKDQVEEKMNKAAHSHYLQSVGKDQIEKKIDEAATMIKHYLELANEKGSWIGLDHSDYVGILRELLPKPKEDMSKPKEIIKKMEATLENIRAQLLLQEIKAHPQHKRTVIVLEDINYAYRWINTMRALSHLGCTAGSAVIVTTRFNEGSQEFCNTTRKAIVYSMVHYYYTKVLLFTSRRKNLEDNNVGTLHKILELCYPHEFCMNMFVRALYANPNRSKEELDKLHNAMQLLSGRPLEINANRMLIFSYTDLHRDYKACFLYLAIFPQGHKIRRSTLVGQWISEGLIAEENWPRTVHRAEQCFDALVDRWLVHPADIGAAGKVKSCKVDDRVTAFITRIARNENFLGLSTHHSAQRSIYRALHRSGSRAGRAAPPVNHCFGERIRELCTSCFKKMMKNEPQPIVLPGVSTGSAASSELPKQRVLDYEGYRCLGPEHIKSIRTKIFLLRYLSLRNTNVKKLPLQIGELQLLEILDIRQTQVDTSFTRDVLLPKLKRLLAGYQHDQSGSGESFSTVLIPRRIKKMTNMEVLSHVEASKRANELIDISNLRHLKKFGVVINEGGDHLDKLLQVISNLHECLRSLSVTFKPLQGNPSKSSTDTNLENPPELLESLSIRGAGGAKLLPILFKDGHTLMTAKVTLHGTMLKENDLEENLAKLPNLRCLRLLHGSYGKKEIKFSAGQFQVLRFLVVECSEITTISFLPKAAPVLEKIVWSFSTMESLSGISRLDKLKEVELNGAMIPDQVREAIAARPALKLKHNLPQSQAQATGTGTAAAGAP